mmetsp:Transcript_37515/g.93756  ORF Transcript_37515/g.93756 Transcript_37515/m.93756 type:complete len:259 (-) Transcript_37515:170-946(-)
MCPHKPSETPPNPIPSALITNYQDDRRRLGRELVSSEPSSLGGRRARGCSGAASDGAGSSGTAVAGGGSAATADPRCTVSTMASNCSREIEPKREESSWRSSCFLPVALPTLRARTSDSRWLFFRALRSKSLDSNSASPSAATDQSESARSACLLSRFSLLCLARAMLRRRSISLARRRALPVSPLTPPSGSLKRSEDLSLGSFAGGGTAATLSVGSSNSRRRSRSTSSSIPSYQACPISACSKACVCAATIAELGPA